MSRLPLFAAIVPCLLTVGAAVASHPCSVVAEPEVRLACFDAAFPPAVDDAARAAADEAGRQKAREEFGLTHSQLRERQPEHLRQSLPKRIEAAVIRVGLRSSGERVVTLDNRQVWLLTEATSKGHLEAGDAVSIRAAAMGTFMLITPTRTALRARRIE